MGANNKYEAAMHGGEHDFGSADPISANRVRFMSESELDRFIAKIKAEAWDEGCNAGLDSGLTVGEHVLGIKPGRIPAPPTNPYKGKL